MDYYPSSSLFQELGFCGVLLQYSRASNKRASSNKRAHAQILQNLMTQIINKGCKVGFCLRDAILLAFGNHFDVKLSKYLALHGYSLLKKNLFADFFEIKQTRMHVYLIPKSNVWKDGRKGKKQKGNIRYIGLFCVGQVCKHC